MRINKQLFVSMGNAARRTCVFVVAVVCVGTSLFSGTANAMSAQQHALYNANILFDDVDATNCSATTALGESDLVTDTKQEDIAKIIIGVAKTLNLGEKGATIGIMTALTESGLKIYANSNVPLSLTVPHQATGNNYDSLGVMQQRITSGWSTLSTDKNNIPAIKQLMDPAYNAEAFFGAPKSDSTAPSALKIGLQSVDSWESLEPWVAAQKVQTSGTRDGSNYRVNYKNAAQMVDQFYNVAQPITLPVAINNAGGGETATSAGTTCTGLSLGSGTGKFTDSTQVLPNADRAVARAKAIADNTSNFYKFTCGTHNNCGGFCDYLAGVVWGYSNSGYDSALIHWQAMVANGSAHPGDRNPPIGAQLFYYTGTFGHVATYLGNNLILTNDNDGKSSKPGGAYIVSASAIEEGPWKLPYLGWAYGNPPFAGVKMTGDAAFENYP